MISNPTEEPFVLDTADVGGPSFVWPRGRGHIAATGTWGEASIKLQYSFDLSTWIDATDDTGEVKVLEANGGFNFELPDCYVRAYVTGGSNIELKGYIKRLSRT